MLAHDREAALGAEIEQLKTQVAEQRGLGRDLTTVLENRNAEIARLQSDVARLKQENAELASDLRLHLGYAERDKARIEALRAALKPFAASAYDRDDLPAEWEIRVPLSLMRQARAAMGAEQSVSTS